MNATQIKQKPAGMETAPEKDAMSQWLFGLAALLFLLLSASYVWKLCSVHTLHADSGLIPLGADLIDRGGFLYKDMHTVMWPGSYLWLSGIFKVFGSSVYVCQVTAALTILAAGMITLFLARNVLRTWMVYLPASFVMIKGPIANPFNSHHWDSLTLFLLFSFILTCQAPKSNKHFATTFAAGALAGASIACYQTQIVGVTIGIMAAGAVVFARSRSAKESFIYAGILISGVFSVLLSMVAYLIATGTFASMVDCTLRFVVNHYSNINAVPYGYSQTAAVVANFFSPPWSFCPPLPGRLIALSPVVVLAGISIYLLGGGSIAAGIKSDARIPVLVALAAGLWLGELHRPDLGRLLFGTPLLLILVFYFAENAKVYFKTSRLLINGVCLALMVGLLLNGMLFYGQIDRKTRTYETRRGAVTVRKELSILDKLRVCTEPYDKIFVYPYDTALIYLAKSRFPSVFPVLHYHYHTDEQIQSVLDDMEKSRVKYVVWNLLFGNASYNVMGFPNYKPVSLDEQVVEKYLLEHYDFAGNFGHYRLMKRKESDSASAAH